MSATGYGLAIGIKFVTIECCSCHVVFAVDDRTDSRLRNSHERLYCPFGHGQAYGSKSEAERLRARVEQQDAEIARERQRTAAAKAEAKMASHRERAQKAAKTRLKNRVAAGVCPCCNRTFANLASHMASKHTGFASTD